jgi:hypothetical protein
MALQITTTNPSDGTLLPEAYARVIAASIDIANRRAAVTLYLYKNAAARTDERAPIAFRHFIWEGDGAPVRTEPNGETIPLHPSFEDSFWSAAKNEVNIFARSYQVLKSYVPEFAAASDV